MRFLPAFLVLSASIVVLSSCGKKDEHTATVDSLAIPYSVVNTLPHNPEAFTEGLEIYKGKVLESTGQEGSSWIAEVNPVTGDHNKKVVLADTYFGEGITVFNNKIFQLTYKTKIGFIYDASTYKKLGEFQYNFEGWGMTHDAQNLFASDGTDKIHVLDTATQKEVRTIHVTRNGTPLKNVNELEYVNGYIYANVWQTSIIVKIDPSTGNVVGYMDFKQLVDQAKNLYQNSEVLNGIAYDVNSKALLITGKNWPQAYLVKMKK